MFDVKQVGQALVESIKIHVAHGIAKELVPVLQVQAALLARLDKLEQQLAALERKGQP